MYNFFHLGNNFDKVVSKIKLIAKNVSKKKPLRSYSKMWPKFSWGILCDVFVWEHWATENTNRPKTKIIKLLNYFGLSQKYGKNFTYRLKHIEPIIFVLSQKTIVQKIKLSDRHKWLTSRKQHWAIISIASWGENNIGRSRLENYNWSIVEAESWGKLVWSSMEINYWAKIRRKQHWATFDKTAVSVI